MNFNFTFLGQSILRYETPLDIFHAVNQSYEQKFNQLEPANKQLVGKIKDEHSLFYDGEDESKMKRHNVTKKCFRLVYANVYSLFRIQSY
jgi:hypothetical protein